jgi:hypothetical protein
LLLIDGQRGQAAAKRSTTFFDGFVGAVVGGRESAVWPMLGVWPMVEATVGGWSDKRLRKNRKSNAT